ncbi:MAG: phosphate acyltransferase PlsX [Eubacteriales bacterium]|jgi:glycerol-3-phosphate acyltransferase PlsX
MKIGIDAHGGDNAPLEVLRGAELAVRELGVEMVLYGREEEIRPLMQQQGISDQGISIVNASQIIDIHEDPAMAIRSKKDSSMVVGLNALKNGEIDAFVGAGSTGALLAGATLIVRRIKGVKRSALAPVMPTETGSCMLIDAGANTEVKPDYLLQFGVMGSVYMRAVLGMSSPRVGLLNNGTEDTKGTSLQQEAYQLLKNCGEIQFVGNVEGRGVPLGECDVIVADGYSGNVLLKTMEGMGKLIALNLKRMFLSGLRGKLGALMLYRDVKAFQNKMDYKEYGGAIFLGIRKPVIKAHGSSDARAFKNAIRQAKLVVEGNIISEIEELLAREVEAAQTTAQQ